MSIVGHLSNHSHEIANLLHISHPGIVKMKALALSYVWWPGTDTDIECTVKSCSPCQMQRSTPAKAQLDSWEWPTSSWECICEDFVGPFLGRMFLVLVDAHSKWPKVIEMKSITAHKTIQVLRNIFARYGLPKQLVTDNGSQFTAVEFSLFMERNGICHIRTAVAKPSTNGLVERFNGTFKSTMRAMGHQTIDMNLKINSVLLTYRNTQHSSTGKTPTKLFLGRNLRSKLDLVKPDIQTHVTNSQMKLALTSNKTVCEFELGQRVLESDFRPTSKEKWIRGFEVSRNGPLHYKIDNMSLVQPPIPPLPFRDAANGQTCNESLSELMEMIMVIKTP